MKIILLGAPGAGKGSQATRLTAELNVPHISTGDAFRMNIKNGTEIGMYAKTFMDKGLLVPDEVTVKIVESRITQPDCANGFLLDGFPRSIPQAEALDKLTKIDCVFNIDVNLNILLARLTGRRSCACGAIYHISTHKGSECTKCGGALFVREDDKEETILKRLDAYTQTTEPLVDYYKKQNILINVDGNTNIDETFKQILPHLGK
jgi:adenylate kinase